MTDSPRLHLRTFTPGDAALLVTWLRSESELTTWAGTAFTWPLTPAKLAAYAAESADGTRLTWTAVAGKPVGHASIRLEDGDDPAPQRHGRLGRVLIAPHARGEGLGVELLAAVVRTAFDGLALGELRLGVYRHNTTALRLYARFGFHLVSTRPPAAGLGDGWAVCEMVVARSGVLGGVVSGT
ncbi:GNAT family N-acetyltransferase [Yinghuangia sp. YIM S09857]|uniref:GNAT family N-acetyltransferase n=1 Tax=Yinghuangia sp. YIM S09857 TaxID=3436929 RepID=UPI003F53903A